MALNLDPAKTALVLIDLQKGILSMPLAPHDARTVVANAVVLGEALTAAGGLVVPVRVDFAPGRVDWPQTPVDAPNPGGEVPADYCDLDPAVAALGGVIVFKRNWGAFHGTDMDVQLRRRGITTLILGGVATNFGVESTAREAWAHNYAVVLAEDATASRSEPMHRFSVETIMPRIAQVRSTTEIVAALKAAR